MNFFDFCALNPGDEQFDVLHATPRLKIERIVSHGAASPPDHWYDQHWDEWVLVLAGEGTVEFEDGAQVRLATGDSLHIPAHRRHRVAATTSDPPCLWLAIHSEP